MFNESSVFVVHDVMFKDMKATLKSILDKQNIYPDGSTDIGSSSKKLFLLQLETNFHQGYYSPVEVAFTDGYANVGMTSPSVLYQRKSNYYKTLEKQKKFPDAPVISMIGISQSSCQNTIRAEADSVVMNVYRQITNVSEFACCMGEVMGIAYNMSYDSKFDTIVLRGATTLKYLDPDQKEEEEKKLESFSCSELVYLVKLLNDLTENMYGYLENDNKADEIGNTVNAIDVTKLLLPAHVKTSLSQVKLNILNLLVEFKSDSPPTSPLQLVRSTSSQCTYVQESISKYTESVKNKF